MYITDFRHILDESGAIGPAKGPARVMAQFQADVVANALHVLAGTAFMRMLRQEDISRLPDFAGQRVRLASLTVELVDREPLRILHCTFSTLDIATHDRKR